MPQKTENLILVHLESFSSLLWKRFASELPYLNEIYNKAERYSSVFVASTSTDMARINLFMASDSAYDKYAKFPGHGEVDFSRMPNLLTRLREHGYSAYGISYEDYVNPETKYMLDWKIWPQDLKAEFEYILTEKQLQERIEYISSRPAGRPFVLYFQNLFSHIQYGYELKKNALTFADALSKGYRYVDSILKKIMTILKENGQGENTLFVFYGDHGDEYWWHEYNPLLAHGLLPYSTQIHVPFFFYQAGCSEKTEERLFSVTECAELILKKLGIDSSGFSPGNIVPDSEIGKIVFAQNLFLNQPVRHLWNRGFSAVSARYLLLASNRGLALYDWRADPENHCNLLWFFRLTGNGDLRLRQLGNYPVLNAMLSPAIVEQIRLEFPVLLRELKAYIRRKECAVGEELKNPVPNWYFRRILPYLNKTAARELNHPLGMRMKIQLKYYYYMLKEQGIRKMLLRAWRRLLRGGKVESRGW